MYVVNLADTSDLRISTSSSNSTKWVLSEYTHHNSDLQSSPFSIQLTDPSHKPQPLYLTCLENNTVGLSRTPYQWIFQYSKNGGKSFAIKSQKIGFYLCEDEKANRKDGGHLHLCENLDSPSAWWSKTHHFLEDNYDFTNKASKLFLHCYNEPVHSQPLKREVEVKDVHHNSSGNLNCLISSSNISNDTSDWEIATNYNPTTKWILSEHTHHGSDLQSSPFSIQLTDQVHHKPLPQPLYLACLDNNTVGLSTTPDQWIFEYPKKKHLAIKNQRTGLYLGEDDPIRSWMDENFLLKEGRIRFYEKLDSPSALWSKSCNFHHLYDFASKASGLLLNCCNERILNEILKRSFRIECKQKMSDCAWGVGTGCTTIRPRGICLDYPFSKYHWIYLTYSEDCFHFTISKDFWIVDVAPSAKPHHKNTRYHIQHQKTKKYLGLNESDYSLVMYDSADAYGTIWKFTSMQHCGGSWIENRCAHLNWHST